jgi:hypothetical protein
MEVTSGRIASMTIVSAPTDTLMNQNFIPVPALSAKDAYNNVVTGCGGVGVEATTTTVVATLNSPLITGVGLKGNTESTVNCLIRLAL